MRYILILTISILLSSCIVRKNVTTDIEIFGLKGKVKSVKFDYDIISAEDEYTYTIDNEFYFNQYGMISEQRQYSSEGLIQVQLFNYNKKNLLISKTYFNEKREFVNKSKIENELNKKGKLLKQSEYKALGNSLTDSVNLEYFVFPDQITEFFYNSNWNLTTSNIYTRSSFIKCVAEFNEGEIIKNSNIAIGDGDVFTEVTYDCGEYDSNKNCIRCKATEQDSTEYFINTIIEYYK